VAAISTNELIRVASEALNPQSVSDFLVADVACALVSEVGSVFTGACVGGYLGLCAEQSAMSALVSKEPPRIQKLVAVWRDKNGSLFVIPPCGRCREFLLQLAPENFRAEIILGRNHSVTLGEIMPLQGWHVEEA